MMESGYLLDTSTFLWWLTDQSQLSRPAQGVFLNADANIFLSAVSVWEMAIKIKLGKLRMPGDLQSIVEKQTRANRIHLLSVTAWHGAKTLELSLHHRDPFDRMLVAQAISEKLTLITPNAQIARYTEAKCLW